MRSTWYRSWMIILILVSLSSVSQGISAGTAEYAYPHGIPRSDDSTLYIIETTHFQVIFPGYRYDLARETAAKLEQMATEYAEVFSGELRLVWPVFLTDAQGVSNAFVSLPPHRAQFNHIPDGFSMGVDDWYTLLVLHEGRHIFQYESAMRHITSVLTTLLGERGAVFPLIYTYPDWMIEGDAVLAETQYGTGGRGVRGDFLAQLRATLMERDVSYADMVHGSYLFDMPNAYEFGFLMSLALEEVARSKTEHPSATIFSEIARLPLPLIGDSAATLTLTGMTPNDFFVWVVSQARERWRTIDAARTWTPYAEIYPNDRDLRVTTLAARVRPHSTIEASGEVSGVLTYSRVTGYRYIRTSTESSSNDVTRKGAETVRIPPGFDHFSTPDGVAWFSIASLDHLQDANRRVLRAFSSETGTIRTWVGPDDTSLIAADINDDGIVVAIACTRTGDYQVVMSQDPRDTLLRLVGEYTGVGVPREIAWGPEGQMVITEDRDDQTRVLTLSLPHGPSSRMELLLTHERSWAWISDITPIEGGFVFISDRSGVQEVWFHDTILGQASQITSTMYGVTSVVAAESVSDPQISRQQMGRESIRVWYIERTSSQQTALRTVVIDQRPDPSSVLEQGEVDRLRYLPFDLRHKGHLFPETPVLPADTPNTFRPYRPVADGFRLTGYGPLEPHYEGSLEGGFEFGDVLGTTYASIRGGYIPALRDLYFLGDVRYNGNYVDVVVSGEHHMFLQSGGSYSSAGLSIHPTISWVSGGWDSVAVPVVSMAVTTYGVLGRVSISYRSGMWAPALSLVPFAPGLTVDAVVQSLLYVTPWYASSIDPYTALGIRAGISVPGIIATHSLSLAIGTEYTISGEGAPSLLSQNPRNATTMADDSLIGVLAGFRSTYRLPLWYPDADLFGLGYLHQIDAGLFMDSAWYQFDPGTGVENGWTTTIGASLACEMDLFRSSAAIRIGGTVGWDLTSGSAVPSFTLLLSPVY